jgi:hypothetical protein
MIEMVAARWSEVRIDFLAATVLAFISKEGMLLQIL